MDNAKKVINVLICDDDPVDRKLVRAYLHQDNWYEFRVKEAGEEDEILEALEKESPDLIFLDYQLPGRSGLDWLREINDKGIAPTIILTGHGNELLAAEVFKSGAYDYLPKSSLSIENLNKCVTNALDKWSLFRQIEEYKVRLEFMVRIDELTGLFNRRGLLESLNCEITRGLRYCQPLSILILDIDNFKQINDTFGHLAGDKVLRELGTILRSTVRLTDIEGRYGGDEFLIIFPETPLTGASIIAEKVRSKVEETLFSLEQKNIEITISIGLAELDYNLEAQSVQERINHLIVQADRHLYRVKNEGGNGLDY